MNNDLHTQLHTLTNNINNELHPMTNKIYEKLIPRFRKLVNSRTKIYTTKEDLMQEFYLLTNDYLYNFDIKYSVEYNMNDYSNEEDKENDFIKRAMCYIFFSAVKKINYLIFKIEDVINKEKYKFKIVEIYEDYNTPLFEEFGDLELFKQVLEQFKSKVDDKTYQWFCIYFSLNKIEKEDWDYEPINMVEIARLNNCTKQNVSNILNKAIQKFRRMYNNANKPNIKDLIND